MLDDITDGQARSFAVRRTFHDIADDGRDSSGKNERNPQNGDGNRPDLTKNSGEQEIDIVVVRKGNRVTGFLNACPHVGTSLNMFPDDFMSIDNESPTGYGEYLRCSTHYALFDAEHGLCVSGPCVGDSLVAIPLEVDLTTREIRLDV